MPMRAASHASATTAVSARVSQKIAIFSPVQPSWRMVGRVGVPGVCGSCVVLFMNHIGTQNRGCRKGVRLCPGILPAGPAQLGVDLFLILSARTAALLHLRLAVIDGQPLASCPMPERRVPV